MKPIKLKNLINEYVGEAEAPHFPTEKNHGSEAEDQVVDMLQSLPKEKFDDNAEIYGILKNFFDQYGESARSIEAARRAFNSMDLDTGLIEDYLTDKAGGADNPNDSDQY